MIGIILALLSAVAFSISVILIRQRLDESNSISVALIVTITGNIILWPLALMTTNFKTVIPEAITFFIIAGILAPGMARLFYYKGMRIVGVSINSTIFATYPLYSSILAVLFLNESLVFENWIGIICIMGGILFIERSSVRIKKSIKFSKRGLIFSFTAALLIAFSYIARKHGLIIYNEPLLGAAIGYSSALLAVIIGCLLIPNISPTLQNSVLIRRDFRLFWKAGTCLTLAWIFAFYALSHERVSIVTPIIQTEPLFVIFLAYLYLKKFEHITLQLILSAILISIGVMLISVH